MGWEQRNDFQPTSVTLAKECRHAPRLSRIDHMLISDDQLIARVSEIVRQFGCEVLALGPPKLKAKSTGHVYGPSVVVKPLRRKLSPKELAEMTLQVTAKVPGITAVSIAR
jgi:hypothetical protein